MGFFDELVGGVVDIAKKEARRAIVDGLREEFGQGNRNNNFRRERQTYVNPRRSVRTPNDFRISFGQNNDNKHRIKKRAISKKGEILWQRTLRKTVKSLNIKIHPRLCA